MKSIIRQQTAGKLKPQCPRHERNCRLTRRTAKSTFIGGTLPDGSISNANEVYNPSKDSWSTAAPIPTPVGLYASAVVDNKIYVEGGGKNGPAIIDLNQIYDPQTNNVDPWSTATFPCFVGCCRRNHRSVCTDKALRYQRNHRWN